MIVSGSVLAAITLSATWSLAWGTKTVEQGGGNLGFSNREYLLMLMIAVCVFAAFIIISCVNADKFGRKPNRCILRDRHLVLLPVGGIRTLL